MKPIYIKLLIAAIVAWIISTTLLLSDIYMKIGEIDHALIHSSSGGKCAH